MLTRTPHTIAIRSSSHLKDPYEKSNKELIADGRATPYLSPHCTPKILHSIIILYQLSTVLSLKVKSGKCILITV